MTEYNQSFLITLLFLLKLFLKVLNIVTTAESMLFDLQCKQKKNFMTVSLFQDYFCFSFLAISYQKTPKRLIICI